MEVKVGSTNFHLITGSVFGSLLDFRHFIPKIGESPQTMAVEPININAQLVRVFRRQGRDAILQRIEVDPAEEPTRWGSKAGLDKLRIPGPGSWQVLTLCSGKAATPFPVLL